MATGTPHQRAGGPVRGRHREPATAPSPADRADQLREQAATIRSENEAHRVTEIARMEGLRSEADRITVALEATSTRATHETDRLTRAAAAYDEAAAAEARLSDLRDAAGVAAAEAAQARDGVDELRQRRDHLDREVAESLAAERSDVAIAAAVDARARRLAAEGLLAEVGTALERAEVQLADIERRHELAEAEVHRVELEAAALVQLAEDTLSGEADRRAAEQAEADAKRAADTEVGRSREIAYEMLGGRVGELRRQAQDEQLRQAMGSFRFTAPG